MKQFIIGFVLHLAFAAGAAEATTFYVAKSGSDSNSCGQAQSSSAPKATINAAFACVGTSPRAGTNHIVEVSGGTYTQTIGPSFPSGSSWSTPFTLRAKTGDTVTIKSSSANNLAMYLPESIPFYSIIQGFTFDGTNLGDDPQIAIGSCCDGPSYVRFVNNEVINTSRMHAIFVNRFSHHIEFIANKVHGGSFSIPGGSGGDYGYPVYLQGSDNLFEGNEMYDCPAWVIHGYSYYSDRKPNNNIIRGNKFHDFGTLDKNRSSGILVYNGDGNRVYNNLVYNGPQGISIGPGASNSTVYNNTVYNTTISGITTAGSNTIVKNNIAYQSPTPIGNSGTGTVMSNNLTADPKFISGTDFRLQSGSSAIDGGSSLVDTDIIMDLAGGIRPQGCCYDIGAYEYSATPDSVARAASPNLTTTTVTVDSTYAGYSISSITDGVSNATAAGEQSSTWASGVSHTDHWVNIAFPSPQQINTATIYWAFNNYLQKFMTAKKVDVQYWNGSSYQTASSFVYSSINAASSTVSFPTVTTSQLRFVMPAGQGNPDYTDILWLTEIQYGVSTVTVDSTYAGYSISSITDGVSNATAAGEQSSTWASGVSHTDHWVNIAFPSPQQINTATIYWAFNNYLQKFMTAKKVDVQYWNGSSYQTASSFVYSSINAASSTVSFPTVTTSQLRFVMPAGQGNPDYTDILWLTEIQYGIDNAPTELTPPSNLLVRMIP